MTPGNPCARPRGGILAVNAGSSSLKFALFEREPKLAQALSGRIEGLGTGRALFSAAASPAFETVRLGAGADDPAAAAGVVMDWLRPRVPAGGIAAVTHRIVHGGPAYQAPQLLTSEVLRDLRQLQPLDPDHLPAQLSIAAAFQARFPGVPQVACFDTAFHRNLPRVATLLAVPRRLQAQGVRRYGFHGISCESLLEGLERMAGREAALGRVILAHLGSGSSLTAVREGQSVETTMGFTPAGGVPMGTRSGDLDPGLVRHLAAHEGLGPEHFNRFVNRQCGLLGVSETSGDMRELLSRETEDFRAAEAVELYCYQVRKAIGGLAAVLGGLDTLVFSGGIGEHSPTIRSRVCGDLEFLGVALDPERNARDEALISRSGPGAAVRVLPTEEERVLARSACRVLGWEAAPVS